MATFSIEAQQPRRSGFAMSHPAERDAVALAIGLCWFGLLAGFIPDMLDALAEGYHYVLVAHVHAASAVGWMSLITWQALLVRRDRIAIHRRNGKAIGLALAATVVLGALATVYMADNVALSEGRLKPARVAFQLGHLIPFAILTGTALIRIDRPDLHKRLLLLGMFAVLDAGWSRWIGHEIVTVVGDGLAGQLLSRFPLAWALMAGMATFDTATRGRLHPAFLPAAGLILATQLGSAWLYFTPLWPAVALQLLGA